MEKAIAKLSLIVEHLAENKKKTKNKLEAALDGVSSASAEGSGLSVGKRSAAARRALRQTFTENPEDIFAMIERQMQEDILSQTVGPGLQDHAWSARGWMEHRSRIGPYKAVAHCGWGVAGIIDALRNGQVNSARARANLLLLQIDQSCIDRGQWTLSTELSLEGPPPFGALAARASSSVVGSDMELPYSRLLDTRWSEIAIAHLRDQDDYLAKRKQLGKSRAVPGAGTQSQVEEEDKPPPVRRPKAKAKQKAASEEA